MPEPYLDYDVIRTDTGALQWIRICILSIPEITPAHATRIIQPFAMNAETAGETHICRAIFDTTDPKWGRSIPTKRNDDFTRK